MRRRAVPGRATAAVGRRRAAGEARRRRRRRRRGARCAPVGVGSPLGCGRDGVGPGGSLRGPVREGNREVVQVRRLARALGVLAAALMPFVPSSAVDAATHGAAGPAMADMVAWRSPSRGEIQVDAAPDGGTVDTVVLDDGGVAYEAGEEQYSALVFDIEVSGPPREGSDGGAVILFFLLVGAVVLAVRSRLRKVMGGDRRAAATYAQQRFAARYPDARSAVQAPQAWRPTPGRGSGPGPVPGPVPPPGQWPPGQVQVGPPPQPWATAAHGPAGPRQARGQVPPAGPMAASAPPPPPPPPQPTLDDVLQQAMQRAGASPTSLPVPDDVPVPEVVPVPEEVREAAADVVSSVLDRLNAIRTVELPSSSLPSVQDAMSAVLDHRMPSVDDLLGGFRKVELPPPPPPWGPTPAEPVEETPAESVEGEGR